MSFLKIAEKEKEEEIRDNILSTKQVNFNCPLSGQANVYVGKALSKESL